MSEKKQKIVRKPAPENGKYGVDSWTSNGKGVVVNYNPNLDKKKKKNK